MSLKQGEAIKRCHDAAAKLAWEHPLFSTPHAEARAKYTETRQIETMAIAADSSIIVNPDCVETMITKQELPGCIAHELMHKILGHHYRLLNAKQDLAHKAKDMIINSALVADKITMPKWVLFTPPEYTGPRDAESLYAWLDQEQQAGREHGGKDRAGSIGCGCVLVPMPGVKDNSAEIAANARAVLAMSGAGKGHSALLDLLKPTVSRMDWRKVVGRGFQLANAPRKDYQTFMRRGRRSPAEGPQLPGWAGNAPSLALIIDVSGSMVREWMSEIVGHAYKLLATFKGTKLFVVTHTSDVAWSGWITDSSQSKLIEATRFSGGTDARPAYDLVRKTGRFDTAVHFTDCELFDVWPEKCSKRLVIGAYGSGAHGGGTPPPIGAEVIPCDRLA